jgi:hypothetical protein
MATPVSCHHPGRSAPYDSGVTRVLLPALLAAVLVAGGCAGADGPDASPAPRKSEPTESTGTPAAEPTAGTPAAAEPSSTAHQRTRKPGRKIAPTLVPAARPDGSWAHLLTADRMPALGDGLAWSVAATEPETADPTGACQKTSLVDIGAVHAVRRDFAGPEDSGVEARQIVARFADRRSARRAQEVLLAWRDDCEARLDYPRKDVGPLEEVATEPGVGGHYRMTYGSRRASDAAGLGMVRTGNWLTIVEIRAAIEVYPSDWNPARRAVRKIATTFA